MDDINLSVFDVFSNLNEALDISKGVVKSV